MATALLDGNATDDSIGGIPVPGALVYVYDGRGTIGGLSNLTDSMGQAVPNPVTTDEDGYWSAYAASDQFYTLAYYWGGRKRYIESNVMLGTAAINTDPNVRADLEAEMIYSSPGALKKLGEVIHKWQSGTAISIACYGDSLTYGQDTSASGQSGTLPFNGSSVTRSYYPYPETLADALALNQYSATATVTNYGYPGDTAEMGYERWPSTPTSDVSIIMFGTNDGKTLSVSITDYKTWMAKWIEREIGKGAVVVLITPPPVNDRDTEANIAPYRDVLRQLAAEYEIVCIESAEQLSPVTDLWSDGDLVHLSSWAYAELGWQLSALFNNRNLGAHRLVAGSMWYPHDGIGYGGALSTSSAARSGSFVKLTAGQRYFVSGYFEDDVLPVIYSYNTSATNVELLLQYSGNGTNRGLVAPELIHVAATENRQAVRGPVLRRGYRTLLIFNNGTQDAYIDAIEFTPLDVPALPLAYRKSNALSALHFPATALTALGGAGFFATALDYAIPLDAPYRYSARLTISDNGGLIVASHRAGQLALQDMLFLRRLDTDLVLRDLNGSTPTDTTATALFTSGTAWTGEIEIVNDGATVTVYVDGVSKITYTPGTLNNVRGFPGLITDAGQSGFFCHSAQVKGHVKGPY